MEKHHDVLLHLNVERPLYEQDALNQAYQYETQELTVKDRISAIQPKSYKSCLISIVPALKWLATYQWKESFINDIISGLTVAIMHIPQGMAYALLGNLPPVVGIYMAFFPVLIYFFFGTSRHVSMGTFAVVCLMTGKAVTAYSTPTEAVINQNLTDNLTIPMLEHPTALYTPIQVATAVTFVVGIYQIIMYVFRLGVISILLSETLVNGFTTGAAIYVFLSQAKDLLGLQLPKTKGYFKLVKMSIHIVEELPNANPMAVTVSVIAIIIMVLNNELLKPWMGKRCSLPIPIELVAVIAGTLVSNYFNLPKQYNLETVGDIPIGLPKPEVPEFSLLTTVAVDSIAITMVSYTVTLSMALIFAQKCNYEVDSNQELLAMGSSNIFGSFFSCMPVSASLSRSLIQQTVGGKTQLASIVSCLILLVILLWIGPFFEPLPRCVLAAVIVVALKGMLMQASDFLKFWRLSKIDGMLWIVTIVAVVVVSIDIGLLTGLIVSLGAILYQSMKPYVYLLGHVPNTDLYLDLNHYRGTTELPGIKIIRYSGCLNFANAKWLKSDVYQLTGLVPQKVIKRRMKLARRGLFLDENEFDDKGELRCIIIDLSGMTNIDPTGINALRFLVSEYEKIQVPVYLCDCSGLIYDKIEKVESYSKDATPMKILATIHDAVTYAQNQIFTK